MTTVTRSTRSGGMGSLQAPAPTRIVIGLYDHGNDSTAKCTLHTDVAPRPDSATVREVNIE